MKTISVWKYTEMFWKSFRILLFLDRKIGVSDTFKHTPVGNTFQHSPYRDSRSHISNCLCFPRETRKKWIPIWWREIWCERRKLVCYFDFYPIGGHAPKIWDRGMHFPARYKAKNFVFFCQKKTKLVNTLIPNFNLIKYY